MTVRSLVGLSDINALTQPVSASTQTFFGNANPPGQNAFANGKGPNGTFLMTDFIGTTAGDPHLDYLPTVNQLIQKNINNGNLSGLVVVYQTMLAVVNGTYTVTVPSFSIVIPSGLPAAGTYSSYDDALLALVSAAQSAVTTAATLIPASEMTVLDQYWTIMAQHTFIYEPDNQSTADVDFSTLPTPSQTALTSFVLSIDAYGQNTEAGQSAEVLQSIATTLFTGQATQACLIEGRNEAALDAANLNRFNEVPDQPTTPPPQAALADASYTVSQARDIVQANLRRENLS
jgi:hypothetical protein